MFKIKLISLNVALFETNNDKIKNFLKKEKPDIVCLQEVTKKVQYSSLKDYISIDTINKATSKLPFSFYAPNTTIQDFKKKDFHGRQNFDIRFNGFIEFGNYIKSQYKIIKGQNVFVQGNFSYITDWASWPKEDPKAVQVVDLEISSSKKIRILNYHGIWSRDKQGTPITQNACQKIKKLARDVSYPSIICGDFNLFPHTDSMKILNDNFVSLVDHYKIKTTRPSSNEHHHLDRNVVDYIYVSPSINILNFHVIDSNVSDHLPLMFSFSI